MSAIFDDDLPPPIVKSSKRKSKKRRTVKREELDELINDAARAAHAAAKKGNYCVSAEAIRTVQILRQLRTLPLSSRVITETRAFRAVRFLATNGNPKIRSESRAVLDHWRGILENERKEIQK